MSKNNVNTNAGAPAAQNSSGAGSSLSMDSRTECLYEITEDYLNSLTPGQTPSPRKIQNELLARIGAEFDAINTAKGKGARWKRPDGLEPFMIAEIILHVYPVVSIISSEEEDDPDSDLVGIYQDTGKDKGIYKTDDQTFRRLIRRFNRGIKTKEIPEVMSIIKDEAPRVHKCTEKHLIAVGNGIFNYDTKRLLPFSKDLVFVTKCYVDYDPNAKNPVIRQPDGTTWDIVSQMAEFSADLDTQNLLWEILGASIRPNVPWNQAVWLYSEKGNNGKGTFCEIVRELVGRKNCASIKMSVFGDPFRLENLPRACAIVTDENDVGAYIDKAAEAKSVITGDAVTITRKFKTPIDYQWHGFMIQCFNEMPRIKDKSDSFFRRQLFVPFNNCFTGHENKLIKKVYIKRDDVKKFILKTVLEMNYYELHPSQECLDAQAEYREYVDPVNSFYTNVIPEMQWDLLPDDFLYDCFRGYKKMNYPDGNIENKDTFIAALSKFMNDDPEYERCERKRVKGKTVDHRARSVGRMCVPEPLIDELNDERLDNMKNWRNPGYPGKSSGIKMCLPSPADKYNGWLRVHPTIINGQKVQPAGNP